MSDVFHLGLTATQLEGATLAIIPGDPARVERIASVLDRPVKLAATREFTSMLGWIGDTPVVVCSTGIQPNIEPGDVIVTTGSVRLDGASSHFAPMEYPAVADFDCTTALVDAARAATSAGLHIGITASSDTFYPGQERYDTLSGRVVSKFRGSFEEWRDLGVLNYEMESATLLTMCSTQGLRAGCVAGVLVNRNREETPDEGASEAVEAISITVVVDAARRLLSS
jgi:uridine phosphorylase